MTVTGRFGEDPPWKTEPVRRVLPWALVSLVGIAGLVGALLGAVNQPSPPATQLQVSELVAATRAAGTARFSYSSKAISRNPLLRSAGEGSGVVDFRTGSVVTVERDTGTSIEQNGTGPSHQVTQTDFDDQIWVGNTFYTEIGTVGQPFGPGWIKATLPNASSSGHLGMLDEVEPFGFLDSELVERGTKVELLRSEIRTGEETTRYRVIVPTCTRAGSPQAVLGSIDIWLDGEGRLVQVRDVLQSRDPQRPENGRSTTIISARLFDFGAPVTISAPRVVLPAGQGGVAFFSLSPKGCPR